MKNTSNSLVANLVAAWTRSWSTKAFEAVADLKELHRSVAGNLTPADEAQVLALIAKSEQTAATIHALIEGKEDVDLNDAVEAHTEVVQACADLLRKAE